MRLTTKQFLEDLHWCSLYDEVNDLRNSKLTDYNEKCIDKLSQLEDIEEKLGFGLNELVQMLTNGIWEVGAVDSETMLPVSQGITHFYIYGVDLENGKLLVFHHILPYERSIERCNNVLFSTLDLDKYKKKCLSGWALAKEELL